MKVKKIEDPDKRILPVRTDLPGNLYDVKHETATAIINPIPGEIRIPYVRRKEKGDFRKLMDALVRELECRQIRFVNTGDAHLLKELGLVPPDSRPIDEVLHGFHEDTEEWPNADKPVPCLVGTWNPDDPDRARE